MIVSVSYRTDIPAFYGEWFRNRLKAGFALVENPYGGKFSTVSLKRRDVDGFVFWTRNIQPFLGILDEVHAQTYPFVVSHTLTGYPQALESRAADANKMTGVLQDLARRFGPKALVWRYDPILISSLTPTDWHLENFAGLARGLKGACDEVVVSFAQIYKKTVRNLGAASEKYGFSWQDPKDDAKKGLIDKLAAIARDQGMTLRVCCQPHLCPPGVEASKCVDPERLFAIAGHEFPFKYKGTRPDCGCAESRDIGAYDSCPQGCAYCYAVTDRAKALRNLKSHDPNGAFLITPQNMPVSSTGALFG